MNVNYLSKDVTSNTKCFVCQKSVKDSEQYIFIGSWNKSGTNTKIIKIHVECFKQTAGDSFIQHFIKDE